MNSSARAYSSARLLVAVVLFAAFLCTLVGSVSPQFHARIHADASHVEHVCAITLIASGSYEHAGQPQMHSAPVLKIEFPGNAALAFPWVKPLFLNAHIFAHAPPVHS